MSSSRQNPYPVKFLGVGRGLIQIETAGTGGGDDSADREGIGGEVVGGEDAILAARDAGPGEEAAIGEAEDAEDGVGIERISAGEVFGPVAHAVAIVVAVGIEEDCAGSGGASLAFDTGVV